MRATLATIATLAALGAAGCTSMAPRYERPAAPVPVNLPGGTGSADAAAVPWREFVREPRLRQLIEQSLTQSRSLRRAAYTIESARAQYRIQRAASLPSIDAAVGVQHARVIAGPDNATVTSTLYSAQGLASWEVDLFGRIKSQSDAKLQAYLSSLTTV